MAEEKPFDPTPARLARAKRDGDVPRSRDLAAVAAFACAALAAFAVFPVTEAAARRALYDAASGAVRSAPYLSMAGGVALVLVGAAASGVAASLLQGGGLAFRLPAPSVKRLDPFAGLRRTFGRDAALAAAKALVVAAAVAGAVIPAAARAFVVTGSSAGPPGIAAAVAHAAEVAFAGATAVAAAFAVGDVFVERAKWKRRLRMSFDEVKRDRKSSEGDPLVRGRRRHAHRNLARGSIERVKDAAFVVANPTHVAVALAYAPPAIAVPRVLVRATDDAAHAVRERARTLGIPIVEDVPLARALFARTDVDEPIPRDTYGAVAAIVAALLHAERR